MLTQLEKEVLDFFLDAPDGTCIIERECSFDRIILHAVTRFNFLCSQSKLVLFLYSGKSLGSNFWLITSRRNQVFIRKITVVRPTSVTFVRISSHHLYLFPPTFKRDVDASRITERSASFSPFFIGYTLFGKFDHPKLQFETPVLKVPILFSYYYFSKFC